MFLFTTKDTTDIIQLSKVTKLKEQSYTFHVSLLKNKVWYHTEMRQTRLTRSTLQLHCANKHNECKAKLVLHFNDQIKKYVTKKEETGRYFFDAGEEAQSEIENVQNYEANLHTHTRKCQNITDDDNHCHITTHDDEIFHTYFHFKGVEHNR